MSMNAVCFRAPGDLEVISAPIPQVADDQVLIKITCCGVCGTDLHIAKGEFIAQFPLIPGHEFVGRIAKLGKDVVGFEVGDRVVADPTIFCDSCFFCRRGQHLFCEKFTGLGVNIAGGFAEYAVVQSKKVYKIHNLTDEEATLIEPAACALHGLDKLELSVGAEVLVLGAGPTGLILAQLLKLNGASKVVIAANKGIKTKIAQDLDAGDEYVELDRSDPSKQWEKLKSDYPYGFDVVVEATGAQKLANDAIKYVRRGGTLLIYGVYGDNDLVHWSPSSIFVNEFKIIGSFAQAHCFPRAVAYLDSGKVRVKGMITDKYTIKEYQQALDKLDSKTAVKIVVTP